MTLVPEDEKRAIGALLEGTKVLELGNKKNRTGIYRSWYISQGCHYISLDWNGQDGAVPLDMRLPITPRDILDKSNLEMDHPLRQTQHGFDLVTNLGFTEHVTEQEPAWRNIHNLVRVGGVVSCCLPFPFPGYEKANPNWEMHGYWQPTVKWMEMLANANNYMVHFISIWHNRVRPTLISRWYKAQDREFVWIDEPLHRTQLKGDARA